jgi:hypothetical protein
MVEQKTSLLERLKICWNVLTLKNYVYFGLGKDPIIWNEDGTYKELKKNKFSCFSCISNNYKFIAYDKETNLHDFTWECIEKFAKEAQEGKY